MGNKINDSSLYPATTPAATDRVLGIDVSNTGNDANGEVVTFTVEALRNATAYATAAQGALADSATQPGDNISTLNNDAGYTTATGTVDTSGTPVALDFARFTDANTIEGLSAAEVKTALDLEIGTDVLAYDANLQGFVDTFTLPTTDGTADQVLKTDGAGNIGFATAGGSGGKVPLSKVTVSSSTAAVDVALTGGYSRYQIEIDHAVPVTDGQPLMLQFSTDSAVSFESSNYQAQIQRGGAATDTINGSNVRISWTTGNAANETCSLSMKVVLSDGTSPNTVYGLGWSCANADGFNGDMEAFNFAGMNYSSVSAATHVRIYFASGNIASMVVNAYGLEDGA